MAALAESPIPLLVVGLVLATVFGVFYSQTRELRWLALLGVPVAICAAGFLVDWWIVTDREAISEALNAAVADLRANDLEATLAHIAPDAAETRALTETGLSVHHVSFARVQDLEITINRLTTPPSALVSFRGFGSGYLQADSPDPIRGSVTVDVMVPYRLDQGRWMIVDGVDYQVMQ